MVEITVVQFKQLRTTTPRKKRNERHTYTLQQMNTTTNEYHRFKMYNKNTNIVVPQLTYHVEPGTIARR